MVVCQSVPLSLQPLNQQSCCVRGVMEVADLMTWRGEVKGSRNMTKDNTIKGELQVLILVWLLMEFAEMGALAH